MTKMETTYGGVRLSYSEVDKDEALAQIGAFESATSSNSKPIPHPHEPADPAMLDIPIFRTSSWHRRSQVTSMREATTAS